MRFNSGSSIKNNAYSASSASVDTNEKLKKLNEELDQLELLVSGMQTSLSSVNSKVGTDTVSSQIAAAKTEIENAIGQEVTTEKVTASEADIDTLSSTTIHTDNIAPLEADFIDISARVKVPNIKLNDTLTSISVDNDIRVPEGAIVWIGNSLVVNKGNGNALIFSKNGDASYYFANDDFLIHPNETVSVSYIYRDKPVDVISHQDYDFISVNSGLTVVGPFYADLTAATFQNITVSNTLTAKTINAENIDVSEDVNVTGTVAADKVEANDAEIKEIESDTITSDRINSSQIHTKIDKENIGYTTVQEHQDTEEYAIGIPITNGLWEIELEGYIKATIDKTNSAVLITYWRDSESALTRVGVKDGVFYFYTRRSGKLYFSNNTLEVNDTTVSVNAPNDPGYPVPETLDKEINIVTNEGVIATETMVVDNLIVTGDFSIKDFTADKVAVRITDEDQNFNVTFTAPLPDPEEAETSNNYIYGDSDLTYNPTTNTLGTGSVKVEKDITLVDSVDGETEEVTYSSGEAYQYLSVSCEADGETLRAHWEDAADTISCTNPKLTSSQTIAAYTGKTVENEYPITHLGDCTCVHGNANVECKLTASDAEVTCSFKSPHIGDGQIVEKGLQFEDNTVRAVGWCDKWYTYCTNTYGDVFCVSEIPENAIISVDQYHCRTYRTRPTGEPKYCACQYPYFRSSDSRAHCTVGFRPSHMSSTTSYVEFLRVNSDGCICEFTAGDVLARPGECKFISCGEMCMPGDLPNVGSIRVCAANITRKTKFYRKEGNTCCEVAVFGSVCDGQPAVYNGTTNAFDTASCLNLDELNVCHLEAGEAHISGDLWVDGTTHYVDTETSTIQDDTLVLRTNAQTGLGYDKVSGIIVNKYNGTDSLSMVTDCTGTMRVGTGTGTSTSYAAICFNNDDKKWYVNDVETSVSGNLTSWATKTENDPYTEYTDAVFTTINLTSLEPVLTRAEASDLTGELPLVWDDTNTKAVTSDEAVVKYEPTALPNEPVNKLYGITESVSITNMKLKEFALKYFELNGNNYVPKANTLSTSITIGSDTDVNVTTISSDFTLVNGTISTTKSARVTGTVNAKKFYIGETTNCKYYNVGSGDGDGSAVSIDDNSSSACTYNIIQTCDDELYCSCNLTYVPSTGTLYAPNLTSCCICSIARGTSTSYTRLISNNDCIQLCYKGGIINEGSINIGGHSTSEQTHPVRLYGESPYYSPDGVSSLCLGTTTTLQRLDDRPNDGICFKAFVEQVSNNTQCIGVHACLYYGSGCPNNYRFDAYDVMQAFNGDDYHYQRTVRGTTEFVSCHKYNSCTGRFQVCCNATKGWLNYVTEDELPTNIKVAECLSDGTVTVIAQCNNELNMYPNSGCTYWIGYRGGTTNVCIGNGTGTGGLGNLYAGVINASCFCGTATSANNAICADTALQTLNSTPAGSEINLVYASMADNDQFRIRVGGASNDGWAEIATADDGNEPIYVRQYTGVFQNVARTATLLDGSGNTTFPGRVTADNGFRAYKGDNSANSNVAGFCMYSSTAGYGYTGGAYVGHCNANFDGYWGYATFGFYNAENDTLCRGICVGKDGALFGISANCTGFNGSCYIPTADNIRYYLIYNSGVKGSVSGCTLYLCSTSWS